MTKKYTPSLSLAMDHLRELTLGQQGEEIYQSTEFVLDMVITYKSMARYREAKRCASFVIDRMQKLALISSDVSRYANTVTSAMNEILNLPDEIKTIPERASVKPGHVKPNVSPAPYEPRFPAGCRVQVADLTRLEHFLRTWKYHHPLDQDQLQYAGIHTYVLKVSYYHGGDVLYSLSDTDEYIWHEQCLLPA